MLKNPPVRWAELRPDSFRERLATCPIVYLPIGLCEPHGHVAALGLDLLKADYYCEEAARRFGGIVAPSQGYHIHECGFHAPWLEEVVGEENPFLAALPPQVMAQVFLYQLRAFANTGFKAIIATSGHGGGSQEDLRRVASAFTAKTNIPVVVKTDPEWVVGRYVGDHAGRYEISQLMAIRPDLIDLALLKRQHEPGSGGRLALGEDAGEATAEHGRVINEEIINAIGRAVAELQQATQNQVPPALLTYRDMEAIWSDLLAEGKSWFSATPHPGQAPVTATSRWKPYERAS